MTPMSKADSEDISSDTKVQDEEQIEQLGCWKTLNRFTAGVEKKHDISVSEVEEVV